MILPKKIHPFNNHYINIYIYNTNISIKTTQTSASSAPPQRGPKGARSSEVPHLFLLFLGISAWPFVPRDVQRLELIGKALRLIRRLVIGEIVLCRRSQHGLNEILWFLSYIYIERERKLLFLFVRLFATVRGSVKQIHDL